MKDANGVLIAKPASVRVVGLRLTLTPAAGILSRNTPVTFVLSSPDYPLSSLRNKRFSWFMATPDGAVEEYTDVPTLTRTFIGRGPVTVNVHAYTFGVDSIDVPLGKVLDQQYTVSEILPTWKFTSFTVQVDKSGPNPWLNNPSIGSTTHFTRPEQLWVEIQNGVKRGGFLFLESAIRRLARRTVRLRSNDVASTSLTPISHCFLPTMWCVISTCRSSGPRSTRAASRRCAPTGLPIRSCLSAQPMLQI